MAPGAMDLLRQSLEQGLDHPDAVANRLFDPIRERLEFVEMRAELARRRQAGVGK